MKTELGKYYRLKGFCGQDGRRERHLPTAELVARIISPCDACDDEQQMRVVSIKHRRHKEKFWTLGDIYNFQGAWKVIEPFPFEEGKKMELMVSI